MMRSFVVLCALFAAVYGATAPVGYNPEDNTAYDYMRRYGIPLYEQMKKNYESNPENRIVGGSPAVLGQFPYQAGLISDMVGITGNGICGGSLVSPNRVVTAAHCWFDGINQGWRFTVVLGTVSLFTGGTRVQTTNVAVHPNWTPALVRNDIAMIYLVQNVILSPNINTIALPTGNQINEDFNNNIGTMSGFGLTVSGGSISPNQFLSHVSQPIITNTVCSLTFPFIVQPSNICTSGANGRGTCQGDSGGPLTVVRNNSPLLVGVTSFGSPLGCDSGRPAAYARVTSFVTWMRSHM